MFWQILAPFIAEWYQSYSKRKKKLQYNPRLTSSLSSNTARIAESEKLWLRSIYNAFVNAAANFKHQAQFFQFICVLFVLMALLCQLFTKWNWIGYKKERSEVVEKDLVES